MLPQSPSQTIGPFFHFGLIAGGENILVNEDTTGQRIRIEGVVLDGDGVGIPDALVEIWQADAQGYFNHPADPSREKVDQSFHGFGRCDTDNGGRFWFKTIKPGGVPWNDGSHQAPHVNVRIFARGMLSPAVTRLYFSDEEANDTDPVLNSVERARRQTLVATLKESEELPCYCFDIRLQGEHETVFFDL
jgi:protocatechuate 3,4-dioxygenase alpha subunit